MSHLLKIFLRIIHQRIRFKCKAELSDTQFGFRPCFGTRETITVVNVLLQKCREMNKDAFICFIFYEKAFDNVQHDKLILILEKIGINGNDLQITRNLY